MDHILKLDAALRVERPAVDAAGAPTAEPRWNKVLPYGTFHRPDFPGGTWTIDRKAAEQVVANWVEEDRPERPVDYHHKGSSDAAGTPDEKRAAGWIQDLQVRDDGLYALIAWTPRARAFIAADEYRYLSPYVHLRALSKKTGKPVGWRLTAVGLLNDPYFTDLPRVAAADGAVPPADEANGGAMDKAQLLALLGLPADASDEDIKKKTEALKASEAAAKEVEKLKASEKAAKDEVTSLKAKETEAVSKLSVTEQATLKLTERVTAVEQENAELKLNARKAEVVAFCEDLVKAGKLTPAMRPDVEALGIASGLERIKFFAKASAVVPVGEKGVAGAPTEKQEQEQVAKKFNDRVAELEGKGMKFTEAHAAASTEMPDVVARMFATDFSKRKEA